MKPSGKGNAMQQPIAAIVVTYNRADLLAECLQALKAQTFQGFDIIVVNNGSTDRTEQMLAPRIAGNDVLYYNTGRNLGGAGGFNYGIRKAYEAGYGYYWLMDDDTIPESTALEKLLNAAESLDWRFGFLVSKALWTDGTLCKMNTPLLPDGRRATEASEEQWVPVQAATFVSFFTSRRTVRIVGLPIKEFFLWADDTNYCLRINRVEQGYWVPGSVVVHKMKSNHPVDIVTDSPERLGRYTMAYRNRYYNRRMEKRLGRYYLHLCRTAIRILLLSEDNKAERMKSMLEGVKQGRRFRPPVEYI